MDKVDLAGIDIHEYVQSNGIYIFSEDLSANFLPSTTAYHPGPALACGTLELGYRPLVKL